MCFGEETSSLSSELSSDDLGTGSSSSSEKNSAAGYGDEDVSVFSELILGLSSAALHYLGDISYGVQVGAGQGGGLSDKTQSPADIESSSGLTGGECHLELAQKNIDYLYILSQKTQGNLSPSERELLDHSLTDLQQRYRIKAELAS